MSQLVLGQDVQKHCNTFKLAHQRYIEMNRPTDTSNCIIFTYFVPGDDRLHLDIASHPLVGVTTLFATIHLSATLQPLILSKNIHRYAHAPADEIKAISLDGGVLDESLEAAIEKVVTACEICTSSGRPTSSKKVSLTHVNEAFNEELQVDFTFCDIRGSKLILLHQTDSGTGYCEMFITNNRSMTSIKHHVETGWIYLHGAPTAITDDYEYNRRPLQAYLYIHRTLLHPKPAQRHNKIGIVERKIVL